MLPKNKNKSSREEILQKKREAERLRYQRLKNDPHKREELKQKEQLKYQKKKEKGQRKLVKDMQPREHRAAKKKWKEHCTKYRSKKKALNDVTNRFIRENTPASEVSESERPTTTTRRSTPSRASSLHMLQRRVNMKRIRRNKKNREKINKEKDTLIVRLKTRLEKYRKRLKRYINLQNQKRKDDTPNTKLKKMLDEPDERREVVKKALFGEVMNKQLIENFSKLKTNKEKQVFSKVVSGDLVEKYKLWRHKSSAVSYKRVKKSKTSRISNSAPLEIPKQIRRDKIPEEILRKIQHFFEDDSVSRMGAGKKEFVSRKTLKKQKRYLLDTMLNLHKKWIADKDNFKISYQTFCRLRPFWVVKPSTNDRDTCLCVIHSNIDLKVHALYNDKILPYENHQKLLENLCCDRYNEECLSRSCQSCINRTPDYKEFDDGKIIQYKNWICERQEFQDPKTKKPRTVTKYLKRNYDIHPRQLIDELHKDLDKFLIHQRNIVHQNNAMKQLKSDLSEEDVIVHMDWSENFCTKYGEEIQAFHFAGSRIQLSLHTAVVYLKNSKQSYCTVSKNLSHSPAAIWAHLQPIFNDLPPGIKQVHFLSDGPVTQYRNKTLFYILASKLSDAIPSAQKFSWNFSESGHGKGAPDGVGATCKRTADAVVNAGGDVNDLEQFVQIIKERCPGIICITINNEHIQTMTENIQEEAASLKSFTGTLKVHQVTGTIPCSILGHPSNSATMLTLRHLSCFCNDEVCDHFKIGVIKYDPKPKLTIGEVFTDSESENKPEQDTNKPGIDANELELAANEAGQYKQIEAGHTPEWDNAPGPRGVSGKPHKIGDFVVVKFPAKNIEYRYAAVINNIDEEENDLRVTFLKICDRKAQTFKVDEKDISDISFDQIVEKLGNPQLVLKGKRIFYKFPSQVDVFEK